MGFFIMVLTQQDYYMGIHVFNLKVGMESDQSLNIKLESDNMIDSNTYGKRNEMVSTD